MIYTIVDEGYNITVSKTQRDLANSLRGFFLEDGTPITAGSIKKFFAVNKNSILYAYHEDETRHWSEEWHYRVECHK